MPNLLFSLPILNIFLWPIAVGAFISKSMHGANLHYRRREICMDGMTGRAARTDHRPGQHPLLTGQMRKAASAKTRTWSEATSVARKARLKNPGETILGLSSCTNDMEEPASVHTNELSPKNGKGGSVQICSSNFGQQNLKGAVRERQQTESIQGIAHTLA
jgi:hypothetical protein